MPRPTPIVACDACESCTSWGCVIEQYPELAAPELDDDGQPIEPGEKYATEAERFAGWAAANHVPLED